MDLKKKGGLQAVYAPYGWQFSHICHWLITNKTPCFPLKILPKYCFPFLQFVTVVIPRESKNNTLAKLWGISNCIMGNAKVINALLMTYTNTVEENQVYVV